MKIQDPPAKAKVKRGSNIPTAVIDDLKTAVAKAKRGEEGCARDVNRTLAAHRNRMFYIKVMKFGKSVLPWLTLITLTVVVVWQLSKMLGATPHLIPAGFISAVIIILGGAYLSRKLDDWLCKKVNFPLREMYVEQLDLLECIHKFEPFTSEFVTGTLESVLETRTRADVRKELEEQKSGVVRTSPSLRHQNLSRMLNMIVILRFMRSYQISAKHPNAAKRRDERVRRLFTELFANPDWVVGDPFAPAPGPVGQSDLLVGV